MSRDSERFSRREVLRSSVVSFGIVGGGCLNRDSDTESEANLQNASNSSSGSQNNTDSEAGPADASNLELVFEDTFDSNPINAEKWRTNYPWGSREHNYNGYTSSQNVYVYDGSLIIEAEEKAQEGNSYTTGVAVPKRTFTPGYVEGYIKVPPITPGFWPAFWLTSVERWPPEIDIFEFFGDDPRAWMTYHYEGTNGEPQKVDSTYGGANFGDEFHRYGVDWNANRIIWYIDGQERFRYSGENIQIDDMNLIFNFGIDPDFLQSPPSDALPADLEMSEVRVWEYVDGSAE